MKGINRWMAALMWPIGVTGVLAMPGVAGADEYRLKQTECGQQGVSSRWGDYTAWQIKDPNTGQWRDAASGEVPGYTDFVWIQDDKCVEIVGTSQTNMIAHEEASVIYVCGAGETYGECNGGDEAGRINIQRCSSLTLFNNSVVNGDVQFRGDPISMECESPWSELRIHKDGQLEIDGSGGRIMAVGSDGRIVADDDCDGDPCDAELLIDGGNPGTDPQSLTLMSNGKDLEIRVKLINRGDVLAYNCDVLLTDALKRGNSGFWRASGGVLDVSTEVRGGATWVLGETGGTIAFNAECLQLSGDFLLPMGELIVNEIVCTTGHGHYGGGFIEGNPQNAFVTVKNGKKITFHGDCE